MSNRREFITLLAGAAVAWPLAARAQRPDRMRRIGVLMNLVESDQEGQARLAAFLQALQELGWADGPSDRDAERARDPSSQTDHDACGSGSITCGLSVSLFRQWRRPSLLRA